MKRIKDLLPETRNSANWMLAYMVVFLICFAFFLFLDEKPTSLYAFLIALAARAFENLFSEAWQLRKQKQTDDQEEIKNMVTRICSIVERELGGRIGEDGLAKRYDSLTSTAVEIGATGGGGPAGLAPVSQSPNYPYHGRVYPLQDVSDTSEPG